MRTYMGTCGWSYSDWKGTFYPPGTKEELAFYAQQFSAVEIDSTFYRMPNARMVEAWDRQTPAGFVFCPKLPRRITHEHVLEDVDDPLAYFLSMVSELGEKLGPILVELPPSFTYKQQPKLEAFLRSLPRGLRFAVEFRHRSWVGQPEVLEMLRSLNVGLAMSHHPSYPRLTGATTDFAYLRLMGPYHAFPNFKSLQQPQDDVLGEWAEVLAGLSAQIPQAYVFVSNHLEGHSPATVARFRAALAERRAALKEPPLAA